MYVEACIRTVKFIMKVFTTYVVSLRLLFLLRLKWPEEQESRISLEMELKKKTQKSSHIYLLYLQSFCLFRDMWNYLDVFTLLIYLLIVVLRIVTITRGGEPYHNRLLEIVNYLYGVNTMLLVLRFSSVLELSSVVGPLQLALFRMLVDLAIILVQFCFVIIAFSVAITKGYVAEMSYLTPTNNQTEDIPTKYNV